MKLILFAAIVFLLLTGGIAYAQKSPDKPVRLVVGFPPGGAGDILGRLAAQSLSAGLHWPPSLIFGHCCGDGQRVDGLPLSMVAPRKDLSSFSHSSRIAFDSFASAAPAMFQSPLRPQHMVLARRSTPQ